MKKNRKTKKKNGKLLNQQDELQTQNENSEEPQVFKILVKDRRDFIKKLTGGAAGIAGIAALSQLLSGCVDTMDIKVQKAGDKCTCHVVCSCDKDKGDKSSQYDAQYNGTTCTCNTVCTCDTVCSCDSDSGGGGGSSYWYPN
jgi:hypothetical protein